MVGRVRDQNPELLRYLEQQGVLPGVELTIIEKAPFDGPISLEIDSRSSPRLFNCPKYLSYSTQSAINTFVDRSPPL